MVDVNAYGMIEQRIEGYRLADLQWGTANAKYAVLRFCASLTPNAANLSVDNTWCVSIRDGGAAVSYIIPITTSAYEGAYSNREFVFVIPPCTIAGSFFPGSPNYGVRLSFCLYAGNTYKTPTANAWVAGSFYATNTITGQPAGAASLTVGDVGLYADPNLTGRAPEFRQANYEDDLTECLRYWYRANGQLRGVVSAATRGRVQSVHPVPMRASPSVTMVGPSLKIYDTGSSPNITAVSNSGQGDNYHLDVNCDASGAALVVGRPAAVLAAGQEFYCIAVSAR
jgi:hypothetical protein